uniref:Uncharacterized protein n=1 Tax=Caenorhabditis tropicalis TaxID=1561998 RepID=A0A1I7V147_9PELO
MAGKRTLCSPLPAAARVSEKKAFRMKRDGRCRQWDDAMGQRRDGATRGQKERAAGGGRSDQEDKAGATTTTVDRSATRRQRKERIKLHKDINKTPSG